MTETNISKNHDVLAMFSEFVQKVEKNKKVENVTRDAKISSFGIDSLAMMEIIGCFEDELDLVIPDEKLAQIQTVGDIERVILQQIQNRSH